MNEYKKLAADYVRVKGAELERERAELENMPNDFARMDAKIAAMIKREKRAWHNRFAAWGAVAASLLLVVFSAAFLYSNYFQTNKSDDDNYFAGSDSGGSAPVNESAPSPNLWEDERGAGGITDAAGLTPVEESTPDTQRDGIAPPPAYMRLSLTAPEGWYIEYVDFDGSTAVYHLLSDRGNRVVVLAGDPVYENGDDEFREIFINSRAAYMRIESSHSILFFDMDGFQLILSTEYEYDDLIALAEFWI